MNTSRPLAVSLIVALVALTIGAMPALAKGGPPTKPQAVTTGNDISWPQCGGAYPSGQAFGIVDVNGGLANTENPCFAGELVWAWGSTGNSSPGQQPKASLYVNTANPGPSVTDWPTNNVDPNGVSEAPGSANADPYGTCSASPSGPADSPACAWQYGWNRAIQDMLWLAGTPTTGLPANGAQPSTYTWWLDVETGNSWETGTAGLANNVADLQGMVAAFTRTSGGTSGSIALGGAKSVGIYSTSAQWGQIVGIGTALGTLAGLPNWLPGARTANAAASNCSLAGFTGTVVLTQWFGRPYDGDYACR